MKLFSPEKANALIPMLAPLIEELLEKRRDLAIRLLETDPALRDAEQTPIAPGERPLPVSAAALRRAEERDRSADPPHRVVWAAWSRTSISGCSTFRRSRDGEPIYLCWKAGEPACRTGTRTDEGFADRKPL